MRITWSTDLSVPAAHLEFRFEGHPLSLNLAIKSFPEPKGTR